MNQQALRFPVALFAGLALATGLYVALWTFITGPIAKLEARETRRISFTPVIPPEIERTKTRDPKPLKPPPTLKPTNPGVNPTQPVAPIHWSTPDQTRPIGPHLPTAIGIGQGGGVDTDVLPIVRIDPDYPARAQSRGIEGWVLVQFTITPAGTVKDPFVVEAHPKGYFEDAALKAIARWRYSPSIKEGVAVERVGVRNIIRFEMEK